MVYFLLFTDLPFAVGALVIACMLVVGSVLWLWNAICRLWRIILKHMMRHVKHDQVAVQIMRRDMTHDQAIAQAEAHPEAPRRGFMLLKLPYGVNGSFEWRFLDEKAPEDAKVVAKYRAFLSSSGELSWCGQRLHLREETEWQQVAHDVSDYKHYFNVEALRDFDWTDLRTPYGNNPSQFPYMLCALTFSDPIIRREAIHTLGTIEYNSHISTATYPTVRFLLELVQNPTILDRAAILEVLLAVARAEYYDEGNIYLKPVENEQSLSDEQRKAYQAYFAIGDAIPFFLTLLAHSESNVRRLASSILGCYPKQAQAIWPSLDQAFKLESDELIQTLHLFNLCNLASEDLARGIPWLEDIRLNHQSELVRCYATIRLAYFCRTQTPPDAAASLIEWFTTNPANLSQQYRAVPDDDYFGNLHANIKWALQACEAKGVAGLD